MIKSIEVESCMQRTLDPMFKGVVFGLESQILYLNTLNHQNFTLLIAEEIFFMNQLVFYFPRNHFLVEKFSDEILKFQEAGLIEKIFKNYVDNRYLKPLPPEPQLRVLTLKQLSGILGVWTFGLFFSVSTFVFEHIVSKLKKKRKNQKFGNKHFKENLKIIY